MSPLPRRNRSLTAARLFAAALLAAGVSATALVAAGLPDGPLRIGEEKSAEFSGLQNVFRLSQKLYTGSAPEGEEGFRALARLGIKTILTVDGSTPDVETARKHGMRYVHLPFGYDGCPLPQASRIVRAVRDLPGPVYLHCHHGKHRSPVGAEFARIALDGISNEQAVRELERAGTGKEYTGLYDEIRSYRPPTPAELDAVKPDFPEVAPRPPLMATMVEIDARFDRLLRAQKAGWKPLGGKSLTPAEEALQLRELFTELNRTPEVARRPVDFRKWMRGVETEARSLEEALRAGKTETASLAAGRLAAGCGSCHAKYRNVPQN